VKGPGGPTISEKERVSIYRMSKSHKARLGTCLIQFCKFLKCYRIMALRHIVLVKVAKKEDASISVEELKKMRESLKPHVPILSFIIFENIGFIPSLSLISFLSTTEFVSLGE
jgi:hypothetical protein